MRTLNSLILVSLIGVILISCKKDRVEETTKSKSEYTETNDYLDQKKQEEQEFIITNEDGPDPITGKNGTKIWISKNCLEFPNGGVVDFPYTVKLIELYTPDEMMYYQMPTVASGNILETGGEIRVRAFKDGQELVLKKKCAFAVEMPSTDPKENMSVFYGFDAISSAADPIIDWTDDITMFNILDSVALTFDTTLYGYYSEIGRLGWLNCDVFRNNGAGNTLTFKSSTDELTQVAIFIYFPDLWGVMQAYGEFSPKIPTGTNVKVICIGTKAGGAIFSYMQDITVVADMDVNVTMTPITDADLTALLGAL